MIEHIIIAVIVAALVWWVLAKLVGPVLVSSGAPFLTTLGNALISGALWYFGGPSFFGR